MVTVPCEPNFHWTSGEMYRNISVPACTNESQIHTEGPKSFNFTNELCKTSETSLNP